MTWPPQQTHTLSVRHRTLQISTSTAKVAIDTLSWLIRPEPGTNYFRSKFIFFDFRIIFSSRFVVFASITFDCVICNPQFAQRNVACGVARLRRRRRMNSRSPKRQENVEFMDLLRFPYFMFEFSLQNTVVRFRPNEYGTFNGADRPLHA